MQSENEASSTTSIWKPTKRRFLNMIEWASIHIYITIMAIGGVSIALSIENGSLTLAPNIIGASEVAIMSWVLTAPLIWWINPEKFIFQSIRELGSKG